MSKLLWSTDLEQTWNIKVYRTDDTFKGHLVMENKQTNQVVYEKQVDLSNGAMFGPETKDIIKWTQLCSVAAINQSAA